jgi:hypothetical protein
MAFVSQHQKLPQYLDALLLLLEDRFDISHSKLIQGVALTTCHLTSLGLEAHLKYVIGSRELTKCHLSWLDQTWT